MSEQFDGAETYIGWDHTTQGYLSDLGVLSACAMLWLHAKYYIVRLPKEKENPQLRQTLLDKEKSERDGDDLGICGCRCCQDTQEKDYVRLRFMPHAKVPAKWLLNLLFYTGVGLGIGGFGHLQIDWCHLLHQPLVHKWQLPPNFDYDAVCTGWVYAWTVAVGIAAPGIGSLGAIGLSYCDYEEKVVRRAFHAGCAVGLVEVIICLLIGQLPTLMLVYSGLPTCIFAVIINGCTIYKVNEQMKKNVGFEPHSHGKWLIGASISMIIGYLFVCIKPIHLFIVPIAGRDFFLEDNTVYHCLVTVTVAMATHVVTQEGEYYAKAKGRFSLNP